MALITRFSDAFARTGLLDGTTPDNAAGGAATPVWTVVSGAWATALGQLACPSTAADRVVYADDTPFADQRMTSTVLGPDCGVIARWAPGGAIGTFYLFYRTIGGSGLLFRRDAGGFVQIDSMGSVSGAMSIDCTGSTISALVNGSTVMSQSDATYANGVPGYYGGGEGTTAWDDALYEVDAGSPVIAEEYHHQLSLIGPPRHRGVVYL